MDYFTVQTSATHTCRVQLRTPNHALLHSLVRSNLLQGCSVNPEGSCIIFKADRIEETNRKDDGIGIQWMKTLSIQLQHLMTNYNKTFVGYNPSHVIIVNGDVAIHLAPLVDIVGGSISLSYPFSSSDFCFSPELSAVQELPATIPHTSTYYSLAKCLLRLLSDGNDERQRCHRLQSLLSRCLDENPKHRCIILF